MAPGKSVDAQEYVCLLRLRDGDWASANCASGWLRLKTHPVQALTPLIYSGIRQQRFIHAVHIIIMLYQVF